MNAECADMTKETKEEEEDEEEGKHKSKKTNLAVAASSVCLESSLGGSAEACLPA